MFIPNTRAELYVRTATKNNFGKFTYNSALSVPCSVIYLDLKVQQSSVRADTSGSRGMAEQVQGDARFCFPKTIVIKNGDVVFKDARWLEVIEVEPRRNVLGQLDHYQVEFRKAEPV